MTRHSLRLVALVALLAAAALGDATLAVQAG